MAESGEPDRNETMKTLNTSSWFWDCYAACYDGLLSTIPYQRLLDRVVACVPEDAHTLLDAGCGTGNLLAAVRQRRRAMTLQGIDFSEAMLRRAGTKVREAVLTTGNLNMVLPYPTGFFDVVTCINVLYAVAQPEYTVAELRRVLKPGGTLIVSSPCAQPRMASFIREHAAAAGWWRTIPLLVRLSALAPFNAVIFRRGHAAQYHFMDFRAASKLLACDTLSPAYASLNWFACITKRHLRLPRRPATPSTLLPCNVL
jgi:ubiquinone/menaquinone biosynthesis C-methylase UbiE